MNFQTPIKTCFNKYAVFKGRASRSEFWFFQLGVFIVGLATALTDAALFNSAKPVLKPIWSLIIILPALAATVRRLHATGRNGWLLLCYHIALVTSIVIILMIEIDAAIPDKGVAEAIFFIGVAGLVFVMIYFLSLPGTRGPNQYGDDPLVSASQDAGQVNYRASKTHEQNRTRIDNLALLERLYDLRQKAILTDVEFEQQKKRILG
jgi:uncharacterized membrane protein YhaH (DUF805 family)